jgi:hypothetical protein
MGESVPKSFGCLDSDLFENSHSDNFSSWCFAVEPNMGASFDPGLPPPKFNAFLPGE